MRTPSRLALLILALALPLGCASSPESSNDLEAFDMVDASQRMARGVKGGAESMGRGMKTAYRGLRDGFAESDEDADYGPYPKGYGDLVMKHFVRFLGYDDDASFRFSRPEQGWMNRGRFLGGGISWRGWLVEVNVETRAITGHVAAREYHVRIRDGEIIEVHKDATLLHRAPNDRTARSGRR